MTNLQAEVDRMRKTLEKIAAKPKYCVDPDQCGYGDCPTAFCDRDTNETLFLRNIAREALAATPAPDVVPPNELQVMHDALRSPDTGDDSLYNVRRLRAELAQCQHERDAFAAELNASPLVERISELQRDLAGLKEELSVCQSIRDKFNDEVQVEIGFKLQAREELEKLKADVQPLVEALEKCEEVFIQYADLHDKKGTPDGKLKAQSNRQHAANARQIIEAFRKAHSL